KSARRTMMEALETKDTEAGQSALRAYSSILDKAAKAGVISKNTAVRRKTNAANGLRKIVS
ncbi:MAG TPA: 30S ribosomal protein S20, partial [Pontiella sp.]